MTEVEAHLGGHQNKTCIDESILKYLKEMYDIKSMIDIGCGPGGMKEIAYQHNIKWTGIDGDPTVEQEAVYIHDYTKGSFDFSENKTFDLAWSVEFLEHVEEKYIPNYMKTFQLADMCVVTAAPPGTPGHHHVNCKGLDYWTKVFSEYGFKYDSTLSASLKMLSTMRKDFFKKSGMVFTKEK